MLRSLFCVSIVLILASLTSAQEPWKTAVGGLFDVDPAERIWFQDASAFQSRSKPRGKSVDYYLSNWHQTPTDQRRVVVLRWLETPPSSWDSLLVCRYLRAFFQLPVRVEYDLDRPLQGLNEGKYSAERLQSRLLKTMPDDAFVLIGLTAQDIYSEDNGPGYLLFGQGHYYNRTAVASLYHMKSSDTRLFQHRVFKLLSHEIMHTFSVEHCGFFHCLMNPSGSIEESDARPLLLCPVCLRKLHAVLGFRLERRYRELLTAAQSALPGDATLLLRRLRLPSSK